MIDIYMVIVDKLLQETIIVMGFSADKKLNAGEMRRAIAGTFAVGFTMLMILSLHYGFYQREIIEFVGIVIGFYFGQRAAETKEEKRNKIILMTLSVSPAKPKVVPHCENVSSLHPR